MTNITHIRDFAQKKSYSVSACTLRTEDFDGTNALAVFNLPEKALVTNTYVIIESAGDPGTRLGVAIGAVEVVVADVGMAGSTTIDSTTVVTGTGKTVYVEPHMPIMRGEFTVIVEYLEYTLGTGHLTNYSDN